MEDTCTHKDCNLYTLLGGKPEQCPNFIETKWENETTKETKWIKDCSPRRVMLMIKDLYSRMIGVQQSQEQQRNASAPLTKLAAIVLERMVNSTEYHQILAETYKMPKEIENG